MNLNSLKLLVPLFLLALAWSAGALGAPEYAKGNGALEVFDADGMAASPAWVQYWIGFLVLTFAVGLIFAWKQPIARWISGGFFLGAVSGEFIFAALNLPWLSGSIALTHIVFWAPGFLMLLLKRPFLNDANGMAFRIWTGVITLSMVFSFIFDFRDAYIYITHFAG